MLYTCKQGHFYSVQRGSYIDTMRAGATGPEVADEGRDVEEGSQGMQNEDHNEEAGTSDHADDVSPSAGLLLVLLSLQLQCQPWGRLRPQPVMLLLLLPHPFGPQQLQLFVLQPLVDLLRRPPVPVDLLHQRPSMSPPPQPILLAMPLNVLHQSRPLTLQPTIPARTTITTAGHTAGTIGARIAGASATRTSSTTTANGNPSTATRITCSTAARTDRTTAARTNRSTVTRSTDTAGHIGTAAASHGARRNGPFADADSRANASSSGVGNREGAPSSLTQVKKGRQ
ncbi:unnamed protein product [Closterium sp. Yama58-4]|nr:unnamed protein product [Closterium sp. Yama58-4]